MSGNSVQDLITWRRKPEFKKVVINAGSALGCGIIAVFVASNSSHPQKACGKLEPGNLGRVETCIGGGGRPYVGQVTHIVPPSPWWMAIAITVAVLLIAGAVVYAVVNLRPARPTADQLLQFQQRAAAARASLYAQWQQYPSRENAALLQQFDVEVARVVGGPPSGK